MTLDLFPPTDLPSPLEYREAMAAWLSNGGKAGRLQRESSGEVYGHMWAALSAWAVGNGLRLQELRASDLHAYIASRGGADELSSRYIWRLLRLVDRVLAHHARVHGLAPNLAAQEVFEARPDIRFANSADTELPAFLPAAEAKRLVTFLSAVRPKRATGQQPWQEVRNRAAVALMLGAGLAPGEVRALEIEDVVSAGGTTKNTPWKLRVAGDGNAPSRETPIAAWAGQLLRYWIDVRAAQGIPGSMVFPSTKGTGKPWGKVAQYYATREVLQAAGIDEIAGGSFRLRHTFALRQLRRGKSPDEVARWLGVSDPTVMARYQRVLSAPVDVV